MNPHLTHLILLGLLGLVIYTFFLMAARRWAEQRGYLLVTAALSLAWWLLLEGGLCLLSFYLTATAYATWFPGELLEESAVFGVWFRGSALDIGTLMALIFTAIAFTLTHRLALSAAYVRQEIEDGYHREARRFIPQVIGLVALAGLYLLFIMGWEAAVLALRTAELAGDADLPNATAIHNIKEIVGHSWMLGTLIFLWPALLLFVACGFMRAHLGMLDALNPQTAVVAGSAAVETTAPEPDAAPEAPVASERETSADSIPSMAMSPQPPPDGIGSNGHHDPAPVQELLDQMEDLRQQYRQTRLERDALAMEQAQNPLRQPNRRAAWVSSNGGNADV